MFHNRVTKWIIKHGYIAEAEAFLCHLLFSVEA